MEDMIQVVIHPALREALEVWLNQKGWALERMPDFTEDDLPTYLIVPQNK